MLFCNKRIYRFQINKLFKKLYVRHQLFTAKYLNTPYLAIIFNAAKFNRLLTRALRQEKFQLHSAIQFLTTIKNKKRILYQFNFLDKIVIAAIAHKLNQLAEPLLSPALYSYRKDKNTVAAGMALAEYLHRHFQTTRLDKNLIGIYLFKTDIDNYTDNIPLLENAELWKNIDKLLQQHKISLNDYEKDLLKTCIRPSYRNLNGRLQSNTIGAPTGTAIASFLCNLYMRTVDEKINKIPDIFYLRYCDDIIMLHRDHTCLIAAIHQLKKLLTKLALKCKVEKEQYIYLHPGCVASQLDDAWHPTNYFEHLGFRFNLKDGFTLSKRRQHALLLKLYRRIKNISLTTKNSTLEEKIQCCCEVVNRVFTAKDEQLFEIKNLLTQTTDRDALRHLDNLIALYIAEQTTRIRGIRALRKVSYQQLRQKYHLLSLVKLHQSYHQYYQRNNIA